MGVTGNIQFRLVKQKEYPDQVSFDIDRLMALKGEFKHIYVLEV